MPHIFLHTLQALQRTPKEHKSTRHSYQYQPVDPVQSSAVQRECVVVDVAVVTADPAVVVVDVDTVVVVVLMILAP